MGAGLGMSHRTSSGGPRKADCYFFSLFIYFPGGSDNKESACKAGELVSIPGLERSPWRRKWLLTLVFLPGEFHGWRSLADYSPWGQKESDTIE